MHNIEGNNRCYSLFFVQNTQKNKQKSVEKISFKQID